MKPYRHLAKDAASDFYFVEREEPERIADTLLDMVKNRMPGKFRLDPIRDIQVLCPMNRGSLGIRELNVRLQTELNPARPEEGITPLFDAASHKLVGKTGTVVYGISEDIWCYPDDPAGDLVWIAFDGDRMPRRQVSAAWLEKAGFPEAGA